MNPPVIRGRPNLWLLALFCLVLLVGIAFGLSSSYWASERITGDPFSLFRKQMFSLLLGLVAAWACYRVDLEKVFRHPWIPALVAVTVLLLVYLPGLGKTVYGSRRWIDLRLIQFQASEVAKLCLVLYLSTVLAAKGEEIKNVWKGFLPPMAIVVFCAFLVGIEPDFSTAVLLLFMSFLLFYLAGAPVIYMVFIGTVSIPFVMLLMQVKTYIVRRFIFLDPWLDPYGRGYHLIQSFQSFVNGGLFGLGPGNSVQKLGRLPEAHTDFVFSVIGEEMGLVGGLFVMALFFALAMVGLQVAAKQTEPKRRLLATGLAMGIALSALLHIGVTLGLLPTTGLPLPFISYGGTDLLMKLASAGLLLNLSREIPGSSPSTFARPRLILPPRSGD